MPEEIIRAFAAGDDLLVEAYLDPDGDESGPMLRLRSMSQEADGAVPLVVLLPEIGPLADALDEAARWLFERSRESEPIDINTATVEDLRSLPGVGPVRARQIVRLRDQLGGFTSLDQLEGTRAIGRGVLRRLKRRVRL